MFDLLMFDLDGTLVDTAPEITDAANCVLCDLGLPQATVPQIIGWIGDGSRELMVRAIAHGSGENPSELRQDRSRMEDVMHRFTDAYERVCGHSSALYPLVTETLQALARSGIPMAVITNKESRLALRVLAHHGLQDLFDPIVAGDTLARSKPDPMQLHYCLQHFGVAPDRALMIGDSSVDVRAAHGAGVACWAVPYGYNRGRPIAEAAPDRVIEDFSALQEIAGAASKTGDRKVPSP